MGGLGDPFGPSISVRKLYQVQPYTNQQSSCKALLQGSEFFWRKLGAGGIDRCLDDQDLEVLIYNTSGSQQMRIWIRMRDVTNCFGTSFWMNLCTQCNTCDINQPTNKGRWRKASLPIYKGQASQYSTLESPIFLADLPHLAYAQCTFIKYGCCANESQ